MRLRDFKRDRRGGVAVTVALGSTMLFGMAAFGVDLGTVVQTRRKAQGAADIALLLQTQVGVTAMQTRGAAAQYDYLTALSNLKRAKGELVD